MLRGVALCLAGGAALALCLPKPGLCFLAWFAPAVLFLRLRRAKTPWESAGLGMAFGWAFCAVALHWIYITCRFALVPVPVAVLAWMALSVLLAANWALYGALAHFLRGRFPDWTLPWLWAALWAALEYASEWTPRLGVDLLGYTQWRHLVLVQASSLLGPHALGFLILLWGAALSDFRRRRNLAAAACLLGAWAAYGAWSLSARKPGPGGPLVEILQPNIDQYRKWDERYATDIQDAFDRLLAGPRASRPSLILWPESALPGWFDQGSDWVFGWARRLKADMLVGALTREGGLRNSAVLVDSSGRAAGIYHKRRLVPFGEFVPLRRMLEPWIGILARMGDFDRGAARQELLPSGLGVMAVTICYEAAFPRLVRSDASRGARVVANLTNDGWYKETWGPYQHFYANTYRAVEDRVTVLRAANTGISGAIDPYGFVLAKTDLARSERLDVRLPLEDPFPRGSFYSRHGDWFSGLCILVSLAALARKMF